MKISVIIPVYNGEKYIAGCLKSLQAQTFGDFECLCVDNGSTDETARIISDFAAQDKRIKLISTENEGKQAGARNKGLAHSTGDLIAYVDADDFVHPQMFELLLSAMERENADVVGCRFQKALSLYDGKFNEIKTVKTKVYDKPFDAWLTKRDVAVTVWGRLYKRGALDNISFIEGIYFEDVPWSFALFSGIGKYVQIDAPLYCYYINPTATMRSDWSNEKTRSYIEVIRAVDAYTKAHRPNDWKRVQKLALNQRVKMILNRLGKTPAAHRAEAYAFAAREIGKLYDEGIVSYAGLKLKHRFQLWNLLRKHRQ